jgi:hypothetical protein
MPRIILTKENAGTVRRPGWVCIPRLVIGSKVSTVTPVNVDDEDIRFGEIWVCVLKSDPTTVR